MTEQPLFRSRTGLVVIVVVGLMLMVGLVRSAGQPEPETGPAGSSYSTDGSGAAGLAMLLEQNGYRVERVRVPVADHLPDPADVLVVINGASLPAADRGALAEHLAAGGRLVAIGHTSLMGVVASTPTGLTAATDPSRALLPLGDFAEVTATQPSAVWRNPQSMLPVVGNSDGALVATEQVGTGTVVAIADDGIVSNEGLNVADHALVAIAAVGPPGVTVRFVEYIHGFERPTGLAALPTAWKQALVVLMLAGTIWLLARGRRLGPPERHTRSLPPPRAAYADALALTIAKSGDPAATASITAEIQAALVRRGGDPDDPNGLLAVAVRGGVDAATARRALSEGDDEADLIARGTVLSQLINKEQL